MNIADWGIGRIMQLPDFCFGRRWLVSCSRKGADPGAGWDISEIAFPERIVLWEVCVYASGALGVTDTIRLALGDQLPTAAAMMDVLEPFLPGWGLQGAEPRVILVPNYEFISVTRLRQFIITAGRRLVMETSADIAVTEAVAVLAVVSSIPKEVPDWLISGPGRSL